MYFPLFLNITKSKFLIIGAGNIALAKLETIVEFTSNIRIVAQDFIPEVKELAINNNLEYIVDSYDEKYLQDSQIIIAATNDNEINNKITADATKLHKLINVVDDVANSQFIFGSYVKRGQVVISASTSGVSPVLARLLKKKLQEILPENFNLLSDFLVKNRQFVRDKLTDLQARRLFWQEALEGVIANEVMLGNSNKAQQLLEEKLNNHQNQKEAAVYFISAGPGDPELMTLKAVRLLARADIILYDRLVSPEILSYGRKDALKINVGKKRDFHRYKQEEINQLIKEHALKGNIVARLKGGDASLFAHLSEEINTIADLGITYQIVPGVTAASGAAAYAGIPLTSRDKNKSVRFLTIYKEDLIDNNYWQELAKTTDSLVLYMSSHNLGQIVDNLLKFNKNKTTPLAVIEQATTPFQKSFFTNLGDFKNDLENQKFISPSLVIIGDIINQRQKHHHWREEGLSGNYFKEIEARNDA